MIFGGLATLIGGFLTTVLGWLAIAVGATLAMIAAAITASTGAVLPIMGPWLTMPWIPWLAIFQCVNAFIVCWFAALIVSFIMKFGVPLVSMGWIKP